MRPRPVVSTVLLALLASFFVVAPSSTASAAAQCTVVPPTIDGDPKVVQWCDVAERTFTATKGEAFAVNGLARIQGTGQGGTDDSRYYYRARVTCTGPGSTFATDGHRNIWDRIGAAAVYPRGILLAQETGTFTCVMRAAQENLNQNRDDPADNRPNRSWKITESNLTVEQFAGGSTTSGLNGGAWPNSINDFTKLADPISELSAVSVPASSTQVRVSGSVNISSCSWQFGVTIGACSSTGHELHGTLTVWVRQRTSPTNNALCGPNGMVEVPVDVTAMVHHSMATGQATLQRDPSCTGPIVARTTWTYSSGRGYIGSGANTTAGSTHVGIAWR